ncbi:isoaspartyl peptidase/L-asparaginase family protein [Candidatus Uabimicrobium amorphum]|uniref:Isoaspartyl peptidase n=1 Tax=Uabimicrobium amorphum TaxID=2596890 RepID=A0A5S9F406_UABAM|nr:isoaspartyl peptidase/L-asparaginase [Candidatus Uabimicrobium amorphum]BBM84693.1 L-asparaginase [Candidatus Uabimicrobium amorphum]
MRYLLWTILFCGVVFAQEKYVLVVHGGAGTILKKNMTAEKEQQYHQKLAEAIAVGEAILKNGGKSVDAVEATIKILEDSPLFNAGKGAVFTNSGTNEMDASIMDGSDLNAGAVASVKNIKNPISAARKVMERSPHVLLTGEGAQQFAQEMGLEIVDPKYFYTESRWKSLQKIKKNEKNVNENDKHGTVGVAALDIHGNLAAGTSTGGMTNKRYGRVGDSPIIGAGTYANNNTCAVSATGHGEYFIRLAVTHSISILMEYGNLSLQQAAEKVIHQKLTKLGGTGGIVSVDKDGNIAMVFNTEGMYRGHVKSGEKIQTFIYK